MFFFIHPSNVRFQYQKKAHIYLITSAVKCQAKQMSEKVVNYEKNNRDWVQAVYF